MAAVAAGPAAAGLGTGRTRLPTGGSVATSAKETNMDTSEAGQGTLRTGFGLGIISPPRGVSLAGYFGPRYNRGVLDHLYARACIFRNDSATGGILQLDLIEITENLDAAIRRALTEAGVGYAGKLIICATHTHTGSDLRRDIAAVDPELQQTMFDSIVRQSVYAVQSAELNLACAEVSCGSVINNPLAFNRRYWMKDGTVATNPGKLNPDIDRPEGPVDREIGILKVVQDGEMTGLIVNIVNHTDTIGGDLVSADWPGFLERALQRRCGHEIPVITLVGASGNINHFDVSSAQSQTHYGEAERIGEGYARIVWDELANTQPLASADLTVKSAPFSVQKYAPGPEELAEAKELAGDTREAGGEALTSEDLARGDNAVMRWFAQQKVVFAEEEGGTVVEYQVTALRFGRDLAIVSLPGEPFTEVGLGIKEGAPFSRTFMVSNANGYAGYLPMAECYARGGYEQRPVRFGGAAQGMAEYLIQCGLAALS